MDATGLLLKVNTWCSCFPRWRFTTALAVAFRTTRRSQPFFVAEVFTGSPGQLVDLQDTIDSFKGLVAGEYDHLPEAAFYMVGGIDMAIEKAKKLAAEAA